MNSISVGRLEVTKGCLILVNRRHPLPKENESERKLIAVGSSGILLELKAASMLLQLLEAVKAGESITAVSGYRSIQEQEEIYKNSLISDGLSFTEKYVAYPGCSEHQTGLAIDLAESSGEIDFLCPDFPYEGICQKFREKAADYGYIERYEKEKEEVTQIGHEPWHFRFVGYPHSRIMKENNLSLEEYTEEIEKHLFSENPLMFSEKNHSIEIGFLKVGEGEHRDFSIREDSIFQISGNNKSGIVITHWKR